MGAEARSEATAEEQAAAEEGTTGTAARKAAPAANSAWPDMARLISTSTLLTVKGIVGIKGTRTDEMCACHTFHRLQRASRERVPRCGGRAAGAAASKEELAPDTESFSPIAMALIIVDWSARPRPD